MLIESENFESPLDIKFHKPNPHSPPHPFYHGFALDPSLCDEELMEEWNEMYDMYGYCFPQVRDQWEREHIREYNKRIKGNQCKVGDESCIKDEDRTKLEEFIKSRRMSHRHNDDNHVDLG